MERNLQLGAQNFAIFLMCVGVSDEIEGDSIMSFSLSL